MSQNLESQTEEWYREYYARLGADRNSLLNPEVLLQVLATEAAMIAAYRTARLDPESAEILDVGCGNGQSMLVPLSLRVAPERIHGIDIIAERIDEGRLRFPGIDLVCGDASATGFDEGRFDAVQASTMFVQLTDDELAGRIAREMVRITKPGGHILVCDWRYDKPGETQYRAVNKARIRSLFDVGASTRVVRVHPAALVPPIGRRLSKRDWPGVYFTVQRMLPFLVGQVVTVLEKKA